MGNLIGPADRKLTDEMILYSLQRMAAGASSVQAAKDIQDKYNVQITTVRLRMIRDSKKWQVVFTEMRRKYLGELSDLTGIEVVSARNRLIKIQSLLEQAEASTDFKDIKDRISTILKCLKAAKDEVGQEAKFAVQDADSSFKQWMTKEAQDNAIKQVAIDVPEVKKEGE